jgi:hypothetical protein
MILVRMTVATPATMKTAVLVVGAEAVMMTTVVEVEVEGTMTEDMVVVVAAAVVVVITIVGDTAVAVTTTVVDVTMIGGTNLLQPLKMRYSRDFQCSPSFFYVCFCMYLLAQRSAG